MKVILILYLLNTLLFLVPLVKQFLIIVRSPKYDPKITNKIYAFVFCLAMLAAMWLCYFMIRGAAWFFFLVGIYVVVWFYRNEKFKQ